MTSYVNRFCSLLLAAVLAAITMPLSTTALFSVSSPPRIVAVDGALFVDELGRNRIFHGTNVVYKGAPWTPDVSPDAPPCWSFNQDDVDILSAHGTNVIRLGVMWPGVEPVRGQYNYTYLNIMKEIVQMCSDAGIYVLLDFHQDGLSEKFCGQGVPLWAAQPSSSYKNLLGFPVPIEKKPYSLNPDGTPTKEDCDKHYYDVLYLTYTASSAWDRLFTNYDGLRDSYVAYWKVVAESFLGFTNILGYDLMNEPFAGDAFKFPALLTPGVADRLRLQPFYDAAAEGIRSVDPEAIMFFESVTWDNFLVGFTRVPGGNHYANKSVLSFHHYEPPVLYDLRTAYDKRLKDMRRLNCGGMLTEFEMGWKNGSNIDAIREKIKTSDDYFMSFTGWEYTDYIQKTGTNNGLRDPVTGLTRPDMATVLSRTFASAIAGTPIYMNYNDTTGEFVLKYIWNSGNTAPTEIRLNEQYHYPGGYDVLVSMDDEAALSINRHVETTKGHGIVSVVLLNKALAGKSEQDSLERSDKRTLDKLVNVTVRVVRDSSTKDKMALNLGDDEEI